MCNSVFQYLECLPTGGGKTIQTRNQRRGNKQGSSLGIHIDGASQGNPPKGGVGGILYLSSTYQLSFKVGIGQETNNLCELMALKLLLQLAREHGIQQIQFFSDSLLVIKWIRKEAQIRNFTLQTLYDDIQMQMTAFSHIYLSHIYRDKKSIVDGRSNADWDWIVVPGLLPFYRMVTPQILNMLLRYNEILLFF